MRRLASRVENSLVELTNNVALYIEGRLVIKTPVDTSKALSNWQVFVGSPAVTDIDAYYPGQSGSTKLLSANFALRIAKNELRIRGRRRIGEPIYISNVVKYIGYLNRGRSQQAPERFVESIVTQGRAHAANSLLRLK